MKVDYETLYRRIGFLFYAEAARKKILTYSDYEKLKGIVKEKWSLKNGEQNCINLVDGLFLAIKDAYRESMQVGEATQLFSLYYLNHALAFTDVMKNKIVVTTQDIEHEFSVNGNNNHSADVAALERLFHAKTDVQ